MQMGTSSWEWMPPDVAGEVMELLKWEREASGVFRSICKGWRDAHDQRVRHLSVSARPSANVIMRSRFISRFLRAKQIRVRGDSLYYPAVVEEGCGADKWLWAMAGLTALTELNLKQCREVSNNGLRALRGLTTLTSLNLRGCVQVSDDGLRALAGLTALTSLELHFGDRMLNSEALTH